MRSALIFMCGLGILAAASATIEESRLGIRDSRFATRNAGVSTKSSAGRDSELETRTTSRVVLEEPIAVNCPKAASNSGDGVATVQLADATH
jgi:hypothetical protein